MSGTKGFAISISARDSASATLDLVNKRIAGLQRQAEKLGAEAGRLGETSGVNRLAEGMKTFGAHTNDAWRSLDRMLPLIGALTGATSIAGLTALASKWAEIGQTTSNLSYRLATPVERIGAIRGALMQVGGSAAEADSGLRGFQATLSSAAWGRDQEAMQAFKDIGVDPGDGRAGRVRQLGDVLGDVAEKLEGKTADAQARELARLGLMGDAWLKALGHGRKAWDDLQKRSTDTGGVMTEEMTKNADKMAQSWSLLEQAVSGVRNRLIDEYAPAITKIMDRTELWIEKNQGAADSIAEISTAAVVAITGLAALKPAAWILRLLGLGGLTNPLVSGAIAGSAAAFAGGRSAGTETGKAAEMGLTPAMIDPSEGGFNRPIGFYDKAGKYYTNQEAEELWNKAHLPGAKPVTAPTLAPAPVAPNTAPPNGIPPPGPLFGPQQVPQSRGGSWWPSWLGGSAASRETEPAAPTSPSAPSASRPSNSTGPGDQSSSLDVRRNVVPLASASPGNGHVQVDVHLKGPPRVNVATSGPVRAPPPRIEMPMEHAA